MDNHETPRWMWIAGAVLLAVLILAGLALWETRMPEPASGWTLVVHTSTAPAGSDTPAGGWWQGLETPTPLPPMPGGPTPTGTPGE